MSGNFRLLWNFLKGNRVKYFASIISMGLAAAFAFVVPLVLRTAIDSVIGDEPLALPGFAVTFIQSIGGKTELAGKLWIFGSAIVGLTIISSLFSFFSGKWVAAASEKTARNMRDRLYGHIQKLPYDYFTNVETGDLIQRCTSDVETVRRFAGVQFGA